MPERIPAGSYGDQMPTIAFGTHPETGGSSSRAISTRAAPAARPAYDGESGMIIFAGSTARNNPVEVVESRIGDHAHPPVRRSARIRAAPGGIAGGLGIERVYEFLAPAFITFSLERKVDAARGASGAARTARSTAWRSPRPTGRCATCARPPSIRSPRASACGS